MDMSEFLKSLTPEQRVKAQKCVSAEEMLALAKEEKVALPDEVLAAVAGGADQAANCSKSYYCKKCGSLMKCTGNRGLTSMEFLCTNPKCGDREWL